MSASGVKRGSGANDQPETLLGGFSIYFSQPVVPVETLAD